MTSAPSLLQLLSGNEDNKIMAVADLPHGNTHTDSERERKRVKCLPFTPNHVLGQGLMCMECAIPDFVRRSAKRRVAFTMVV